MNKIKYIDMFGKTHNLTIYIAKYQTNCNRALILVEKGEPFADLTINIDTLSSNQVCIDTNNFPDAIKLIKEYDLGEPTSEYKISGFCTYPVYKLNMENIKKYECKH